MGKRVEIKTFKTQNKDGIKETPIEHEFEMYDEMFVVHEVLRLPETWMGRPLYRASHRDTGFGVPDCVQGTPVAAEHQARAVMKQVGREHVLEAVRKAEEAGG